MSKSNKEILKEFIQQVMIEKKVELMDTYHDLEYVWHRSPYVGIGFSSDDSQAPGSL